MCKVTSRLHHRAPHAFDQQSLGPDKGLPLSQKCSKCKEAEEASLAAAAEAKKLQPGSKVSFKETLGALFSGKKEGEGMTEKIAFEKLPPALVIHLKRTQCVPLEGGGCAYQKNDVPVQVNMVSTFTCDHLNGCLSIQIEQFYLP